MKKILISFMCALLLFSGCAKKEDVVTNGGNVQLNQKQIEFDELMVEIFIDYISQDAMTLHYNLENPEVYGIRISEYSLGELSVESDQKFYEQLNDWKTKLSKFKVKSLTSTQQTDYEMIMNYIEMQLAFKDLDFFSHLFSSSSGLTSNLTTIFMEFSIYQESDFDMYLALLEDVDRYLDDGLKYTQQQVEMGLFMQDFSVDKTVAEIDKFISKVNDNELIVSFEDKLESFDLSKDKKEAYSAQNKKVIIEEVIPAYQKVKQQLLDWKGTAKATGGYATIENGKKFYSALFQYKTGVSGSIDTLFKQGNAKIQELMNGLYSLMMSDDGLYDRYINNEFELKEPVDILQIYQSKLLEKYPQGPVVTYRAEYLDPTIANANTSAYYLIPPFDKIEDNIIRINPINKTNTSQLYPTLAHEGFPGHLYQTTYYLATEPNPLRTVFDSLGYVEGWAMYTEVNSFEWLLPDDPKLSKFLGIDIYYPMLVQAMVDIGVNYYGWTEAETKQYLEQYGKMYGFEQDEVVKILYESSISNPGMFLPYGVGLLKMDTLRTKAEKQLGEKFNEITYHQAILENGALTFDLLEKKVEAYIKENN